MCLLALVNLLEWSRASGLSWSPLPGSGRTQHFFGHHLLSGVRKLVSTVCEIGKVARPLQHWGATETSPPHRGRNSDLDAQLNVLLIRHRVEATAASSINDRTMCGHWLATSTRASRTMNAHNHHSSHIIHPPHDRRSTQSTNQQAEAVANSHSHHEGYKQHRHDDNSARCSSQSSCSVTPFRRSSR